MKARVINQATRARKQERSTTTVPRTARGMSDPMEKRRDFSRKDDENG